MQHVVQESVTSCSKNSRCDGNCNGHLVLQRNMKCASVAVSTSPQLRLTAHHAAGPAMVMITLVSQHIKDKSECSTREGTGLGH